MGSVARARFLLVSYSRVLIIIRLVERAGRVVMNLHNVDMLIGASVKLILYREVMDARVCACALVSFEIGAGVIKT